jgi:hypothetical protein
LVATPLMGFESPNLCFEKHNSDLKHQQGVSVIQITAFGRKRFETPFGSFQK